MEDSERDGNNRQPDGFSRNLYTGQEAWKCFFGVGNTGGCRRESRSGVDALEEAMMHVGTEL